MSQQNVCCGDGVKSLILACSGGSNVGQIANNVMIELDKKGVCLEAATTLWDIASQECRHRFNGKVSAAKPTTSTAVRPAPAVVKIRKPERVPFGVLEPSPA